MERRPCCQQNHHGVGNKDNGEEERHRALVSSAGAPEIGHHQRPLLAEAIPQPIDQAKDAYLLGPGRHQRQLLEIARPPQRVGPKGVGPVVVRLQLITHHQPDDGENQRRHRPDRRDQHRRRDPLRPHHPLSSQPGDQFTGAKAGNPGRTVGLGRQFGIFKKLQPRRRQGSAHHPRQQIAIITPVEVGDGDPVDRGHHLLQQQDAADDNQGVDNALSRRRRKATPYRCR